MRLTDITPPYCSGCFGQYHNSHVDFESDWDGPVLNKEGLRVQIDELILCENCVRAAYSLLPKKEDQQIEKLQDQLKEIRASNRKLTTYNRQLETTIGSKP